MKFLLLFFPVMLALQFTGYSQNQQIQPNKNIQSPASPLEFTWSVMGSFDDPVNCVYVSPSNQIFAGGNFSGYIAEWNGSEWVTVGSGLLAPVKGITEYDGSLYVISNYSDNYNLAILESGTWNYIFNPFIGTVNSIIVYNDKLLAGGDFGNFIPMIYEYDGTDWSPLEYAEGVVNCMAVSGSDLIVGGSFLGQPSNNIQKYSAGTWQAIGTGLDGTVHSLAINGAEIYAGGSFNSSSDFLMKWDGSDWSAIPGSPNGIIYSLIYNFGDLYAGGNFDSPGNNIAKYDGAVWTSIGLGTNGRVNALALASNLGKMIVGGIFTSANDEEAFYIANFSDSDNPLPVELTYFSASVIAGSVKIVWETATEIENYGFFVQRFNPASGNWDVLSFVEGAGTVYSPRYYNYSDVKPHTGVNKYRLKQVDYSGEFEFSSEISINFSSNPVKFELGQSFPNPFVSGVDNTVKIPVTLSNTSYIILEVFTSLGERVYYKYHNEFNSGKHHFSLDALKMTNGVYFYSVTTQEGTKYGKMVVKGSVID